MKVKSKTRLNNSLFHKRRVRFAFTVKKYDIDKPEILQINNILKDNFKDCTDKSFYFSGILVKMIQNSKERHLVKFSSLR